MVNRGAELHLWISMPCVWLLFGFMSRMIDCCWHTGCHQSQHSDKWRRGVAAGEIMQPAHRHFLIISPVCAHSAALLSLSVNAKDVIIQCFLVITNYVVTYTWIIGFDNTCSCSLSICVVDWESPLHGQSMTICWENVYRFKKKTSVFLNSNPHLIYTHLIYM